MIINKSGVLIRLKVSDCRVMGRATQGVRLINLTKKNDVIASVCKVMSSEVEAVAEAESQKTLEENIGASGMTDMPVQKTDGDVSDNSGAEVTPLDSFDDEENNEQ